MIADMDDVEVNLEEARAKAYNLDLQHSEKILSMRVTKEEELAKVEEVLEVVTAAKLMIEDHDVSSAIHYVLLFMLFMLCHVLYPFTERHAQPYFFHVLIRQTYVSWTMFSPSVSQDAVLLRMFPFTLTGSAKRCVDRLTSGAVNTWDLLKKPLSKAIVHHPRSLND
nr:hypothetical protein [Tanacetum cinerariifolium]